MTVSLVICADDFGRNEAINEAVLILARRRVVTAVSVMVDEPFAGKGAGALDAIPGLETGLHITLSDAPIPAAAADLANGGVRPHIDRLTLDAYRGRLPLAAIRADVARQFTRFEQLFGRAPDFVDAHQHAHVLPGIRDAVLDETARHGRSIWVRTCEDDPVAIARRGGDRLRAWRSALLSHGLRSAAAARGLVTNDSFAGLYDLRAPGRYAQRFPAFLRRPAARNHLVIVHPATIAGEDDPIGHARADEFAYLRDVPLDTLAHREGLAVGGFR